ncbi:cell wall-binding repeat-containing protein, partial [Candidatus Woesearchaeota archaeon]|nr:cell wall-binding repeat-containing protein [Candidatus Woesearchaeota archaeon]
YFTVDTPPIVNVQSPLNQTYATTSVWVNVTLNEDTGSVIAQLDAATNYSLSNTSGNWNYLLTGLNEGTHNVRIFANDSTGNMNSTQIVYFTVDTVAPTINIISPTNTTYEYNTAITLTYGANEAIAANNYQLDGGANTTFNNGTTTITPAVGNHNLRIWARDSGDNWGTAIVYFTATSAPSPLPAPVAAAGGGGGFAAPPPVLKGGTSPLTPHLLKELIEEKRLESRTFYSGPMSLAPVLSLVGEYPVPTFPVVRGLLTQPVTPVAEVVRVIGGVPVTSSASIEEMYNLAASKILKKYEYSDVHTVVISKRDPPVDGIAAVAYARSINAPILLTEQYEVPEVMLGVIKKLRADKIVIVGGPTAISPEVEEELKKMAPVERIWGDTRYETAVKMADKVENPKAIVITDGTAPSMDAVIIAAEYGAPIVYTKGSELPEATTKYLLSHKTSPVYESMNWVIVGVEKGTSTEIEALYSLPEFLARQKLALKLYKASSRFLKLAG